MQNKQPTLRFVPKFVNGYWVTFDTVNYENTHVHLLQKVAVEFTKNLNNKKA